MISGQGEIFGYFYVQKIKNGFSIRNATKNLIKNKKTVDIY